MEIFVSSIAFIGKTPEEMTATAVQHGWPLEFSSGMAYREDLEQFYLHAPVARMPHNYFPPPADPFVLNLGSTDENIRERSVAHCINGLRITRATGGPFFAAHAGFCIDPLPDQLGRQLEVEAPFAREVHMDVFVRSLEEIISFAEEMEIDFLIENNVIAPFNLPSSGANPLLCCESADILAVFNRVQSPRLGLLLDTAHLKVSCRTLRLDAAKELGAVRPFIRGIHHSDNDGLLDDNRPLRANYWFLPHMPAFNGTVHVLEVRDIAPAVISEQLNLLYNHGR
ncbi:sugar phosphate isomerase/epimerase family protein [Chitinophaga lutea]